MDWLVHPEAIEGRDYDVERVTAFGRLGGSLPNRIGSSAKIISWESIPDGISQAPTLRMSVASNILCSGT